MLSPIEAAAFDRGQEFKRVVRAAAAMSNLYDDTTLADAVGIGRGAVLGWWKGAKPEPKTVYQIAAATGLSADELSRFLYDGGPPPTLPEPGSWVASSVQEGLRRDQERPPAEVPDTPEPSPQRQSRGSEATRR